MFGIMRRKRRRSMRLPVRFYSYLSKVKVDMLYPQIPRSFLRPLQIEVTARTGLLDATLKRGESPVAEDVAVRLAIVEAYLTKNEKVGSLSDPGPYIRDWADFQYGVLSGYPSDLAIFVGVREDARIALIGSSDSLIGAVPKAEGSHTLNDYLVAFLNQLAETEDVATYSSTRYEHAIDEAMVALPAARSRMEFLARLLYRDAGVVVATPLYVAFAD